MEPSSQLASSKFIYSMYVLEAIIVSIICVISLFH